MFQSIHPSKTSKDSSHKHQEDGEALKMHYADMADAYEQSLDLGTEPAQMMVREEEEKPGQIKETAIDNKAGVLDRKASGEQKQSPKLNIVNVLDYFDYNPDEKRAGFEAERFEQDVLEAYTDYYLNFISKNGKLDAEQVAALNISVIRYLEVAGDMLKMYVHKLDIPGKDKNDLHNLFTKYQIMVGERIHPYTQTVMDAEAFRELKKAEAKRRKWELDNLYYAYLREKDERTMNDLKTIGIGVAGIAVTIATAGSTAALWVGLVGGTLAVAGGSFKLMLDDTGKQNISKWVPTDYSDLVGVVLQVCIEDTGKVEKINAVLDVIEGAAFLGTDLPNQKALETAFYAGNVAIQSMEVITQYKK